MKRFNRRKKLFIFIILALACILLLYKIDWSGFGESHDKNVLTVTETITDKSQQGIKILIKKTITDKIEPAKTLWDWMALFLAPATLAFLGFLFQHSQEKAKETKSDQDRKRVADQQREAALQDYLNILSGLLVDKRLKYLLSRNTDEKLTDIKTEDFVTEISILEANPDIDAEAALNVVKARTLSLLRLFEEDIPRKVSVLSFLGDVDLLTRLELDLSRSNLNNANLRIANLSKVKLRIANLSGADLIEANLNYADLSGADLSSAYLISADLSYAKLRTANFNGADLTGAKLIKVDLSDARLCGANFSGADFSGADCSGADFTGAKLYGANFSDARLISANLADSIGLLRNQLVRRSNPPQCLDTRLPAELDDLSNPSG